MLIDALLFNPAMTLAGAVGAAAILAPVLCKPGRLKLMIACLVLAPVSPFIVLAWLGGRLIALSQAIETRMPGAAWAADVITRANHPASNVIPFNPNRTRKGGKPA